MEWGVRKRRGKIVFFNAMKSASHTQGPWSHLTGHVQHDGAKLAAPQALGHRDDVVAGVPHAHTEQLDGAIVKGADSVPVALGDVGLSPRLPLHNLLLQPPGGCVLPFDGGDARAGVLHREQNVFVHRGIDGRLGDVQ